MEKINKNKHSYLSKINNLRRELNEMTIKNQALEKYIANLLKHRKRKKHAFLMRVDNINDDRTEDEKLLLTFT